MLYWIMCKSTTSTQRFKIVSMGMKLVNNRQLRLKWILVVTVFELSVSDLWKKSKSQYTHPSPLLSRTWWNRTADSSGIRSCDVNTAWKAMVSELEFFFNFDKNWLVSFTAKNVLPLHRSWVNPPFWLLPPPFSSRAETLSSSSTSVICSPKRKEKFTIIQRCSTLFPRDRMETYFLTSSYLGCFLRPLSIWSHGH